jgi:hypothetical protein
MKILRLSYQELQKQFLLLSNFTFLDASGGIICWTMEEITIFMATFYGFRGNL